MKSLAAMFAHNEWEFLQFDKVPSERRLSERPDLCAFLLLNKLAPGAHDIIQGAEHDEIWLDVDLDMLTANATEDDVLTLVRCGVRMSDERLAMFV